MIVLINSSDGWRQDYDNAIQKEHNDCIISPSNTERFIRRCPEDIQQHFDNIKYYRAEKRSNEYAVWNWA